MDDLKLTTDEQHLSVAVQAAFTSSREEIEDYLADENDLSSRMARLLCYRLSSLVLSNADDDIMNEAKSELIEAIKQCPWFKGLIEYQLDEIYFEEEKDGRY